MNSRISRSEFRIRPCCANLVEFESKCEQALCMKHGPKHPRESRIQLNFERNRAFGLNAGEIRMQVRTPIFSKKHMIIHPKRFKIEPKSVQNRLPGRSRSLWGPESRPRAPESAPRGPPSDPKGALGGPQGRPKRDQGRPKTAQRGSEGSPERPRERQNRPEVDFRSEKSQICGKCSCLLYTSPSPRDKRQSRMPSSA